MGNSGSKLVKKIVSPLSTDSQPKSEPDGCESIKLATPYVLSRKGSMFFDEDGDLAHEFYVEEPPQKKGAKATMRRVYTNLKPQLSGVMSSGGGYSTIDEILSAMDILVMAEKTYKKYHDKVCKVWAISALKEIEAAAKTEVLKAIENGMLTNMESL